MAFDPEILRHKEWLGFLQPVGLVVSPPALVKAQAVVNRNVVKLQESLLVAVSYDPIPGVDKCAWIADFELFAAVVLEWQPDDLVDEAKRLVELEVVLPDYREVLTPTYAVPNPDDEGWLMLVQVVSPGTNLDEPDSASEKSDKWHASPQAKFERLLREKEIPVGLLCNGTDLRLVYAPRGESSGHLTFPVQAMCEVSGRLILGAMNMLLSAFRLFNAPSDRRLSAILVESRKYQSEVSTKLAEQVLEALWNLLRGFQSANAAGGGQILGEIALTEPQHIYGGLITTLMRLVFLLYAEDEGLMSGDSVYTRNYSVAGLYERLREDAGNYPDTMDQRYGAWAWLLSLFRLVYEGGGHAAMHLPARHGQLFYPDEYPFLEGRPRTSKYEEYRQLEPPRIADGVIYRVLQGLLVLDGERLSYRSLDVEQIGSVYEAIMGFAVEQAEGASIGVRPHNVVVNVENLLVAKPSDRAKLLKDWAACELTGKSLIELKEAKTPEDVVAALGRKVSPRTPNLMPTGSLYLQPGEERRRSGSHYTPRALTEPIVRTTLRPVLEALGERPTAVQILSLKICDLAMGSGAFLVETCRQLAEQLVQAWDRHGNQPELPPDEEPLLHARRLVAQRCLYGVDKNPFAVNLAKLSLWLVTLAKEHSFTFLDHALKHGDSLVGLTCSQIESFSWEQDTTYDTPLLSGLKQQMEEARKYRDEILALGDDGEQVKRQRYQEAETALQDARLMGDLIVAAFFSKDKDKARKEERDRLWLKARAWQHGESEPTQVSSISQALRSGKHPVPVFNWEIEFPEVFERENPGFDAIVGNPPFLHGKKISGTFGGSYLAYLLLQYPESIGTSDLVAFFFRRAFVLLRKEGAFGLIATNTISQGDTRYTGLRFICNNGGSIYSAIKRLKWSGSAAVVATIVTLYKGSYLSIKLLNGQEASLISAFLFHRGSNDEPLKLMVNTGLSFQGSIILGMGFTFDDTNPDTTSLAEMYRLIEQDPRNQERIFPYIGGEEVNSSPTHSHHRYVINFGEMSKADAQRYPDLMAILEEKIYPERITKPGSYSKQWWLFGRRNKEGQKAITQCNRVLVTNCGATSHMSFSFQSSRMVFANSLAVFPLETYSAFCTLQSRIHEIWARFFGSSMKDDLRYTPSNCFETFPFPGNWESNPNLEAVGKEYYEFRATLMIRNNQGLTDTYNRFHDPNEYDSDILKLRELHAQMDRAVLDAYGWTDISTECTFLLDYEEEEEEESTGRQKKKPWRYRWPEEIHDEVLARLLVLNKERAEAERIAGAMADKAKQKGTKKKANKSSKANSPTLPNFLMVEEDI